jgi:hypothetical protein
MNSNESIREWELSAIRAIKKRDLWLFVDIYSLMKLVLGENVARSFMTRLVRRREYLLSVSDDFWLSLNAYLWEKINDK